MATTANKNCKQFIGIVTGEDGITARSGDEPGKGTVKLQTAEINESESTSSETVYQISNTGSTDIEVYNYTEMAFAKDEEVEIWQDGYGVFWATPTKDYRDFFVISRHDSYTYAKNGNSFYIVRGTYGVDNIPCWRAKESNFTISEQRRIAICQEDIPDDYFDDPTKEYYFMPYFTPEMNYGEKPNVSAVSGEGFEKHCGVATGEHVFSNKRLDYTYNLGRYIHTPEFLYRGTAISHNGEVGIVIEGITYTVQFPFNYSTASYSLTSYPDVYAGDIITVRVTDYNGQINVYAVEYQKDFRKGFSLVVESTNYFGRGWDTEAIQGTDFYFAWKTSDTGCLTPPPQ